MDYADKPKKLEGARAGFEACRGKTPDELRALLKKANEDVEAARTQLGVPTRPDFSRLRCFAAEVEWTCNVISFLLQRAGVPTIVAPTARAAMTAATILGVAAPD